MGIPKPVKRKIGRSSATAYGKAGTAAETLTATTPALVLWGFAYGAQAGDVMRITITGPAGLVMTQDAMLDRSQAQFFRAVGSRSPTVGWPPGDYAGTVDLIRNHAVIDSLSSTIKLR